MWSEANILHFENKVSGDVLPVLAALYNIIQKQGYQDIVLDFSRATFLSSAHMLPLVTMCRSYRQQRVSFELILPEDRKTAALISNTNWAHLIDPEKFDSKDENNIRHLSATQFRTASEHHKSVDRSIGLLLQYAEGIDRNRLKALEWSLNEITDNVLNHADSPVGGIMQVVNYRNQRCVELMVCDAGQTIPKSLRQSKLGISDDATAMRRAIEEGVTRNTHTNQGNGLFGTFKCCDVSGGEFEIISGSVVLRHRPGTLSVTKSNIPFTGTFVRALIRYDYEELLERALVFRGKSHDPAFDYVERFYEGDGEAIKFIVLNELESFGSRESGRLARTKIENLMNLGKSSIEFDFEGVHLISSSFADEVFGRIYVELGPIRFSQLCRFRNVDSTVQGLIDRAIAQRMRLGPTH